MSKSPISLLLLRRQAFHHIPKPQFSLLHHDISPVKPFSTSTSTATSSPDPPKPTSLTARMSFVFDQIDAITRDREEKDKTLQRIRAWRQSKNTPQPNPESISSRNQPSKEVDEKIESGLSVSDNSSANLAELNTEEGEEKIKKKKENEVVELVHPWPEWIELMERLVQQNYFDHRRKDEDKMIRDLGLDVSGIGSDIGDNHEGVEEAGVDFTRDIKAVQTACLNFGKDRFDISRSLSRQDIQVLVGYGCPNADKKVVFSAKLLRKHVHLDEGDVCSNCSLRSSCERAYLLTNKEDEARTIDVMRVLLAYGLDPSHGTITNKSLLKQKSVKIVVRKILHEIVKLSAVPIDPNLPPPVIKKPPQKVKQPPPPPKKRVGRDDIEMKKGDWLCPKCDFMNFAKNTVCLQCDAKRPKRQLLPGEWECPQCNFLNYRRNMVCFHCECKRPPDGFVEGKMEERQLHSPRTRLEKTARRPDVSNAWNFNFDDDESDGADVAAFEYADSGAKTVGYPDDGKDRGENFRGHDADLNGASNNIRMHEREHFDPNRIAPGKGFDDFDDEDDIDSYEVDTQNSSSPWKTAQHNLSRRGISDFEDYGGSDDDKHVHPRSSNSSYTKSSKPKNQKGSFSGPDFDDLDADSDEELSEHPKWRSSHVADTNYRNASRGPKTPLQGLSFGSDEEGELDSDVDDDFDDDFGSNQKKGNKQSSHTRNFKSSDLEHASFSGSDSDNDLMSGRNRSGRKKMDSGRDMNSRNRGHHFSARNSEVRSRGWMGDRRSLWNDDFDESSRGSYRRAKGRAGRRMDELGEFQNSDRRGSRNDNFDGSPRGRGHTGRRMNDRPENFRDLKGPREQGLQNRQWGRRSEYTRDMDGDFGEFRNSRRVIER